jgi:hypothetical protein
LDYDAWEHDGTIVLRVEAKFSIENTGRAAAYKWSLRFRRVSTMDGREEDYFVGRILPGASAQSSSIRIDDTILPGCFLVEKKIFGLRLRSSRDEKSLRGEIEALVQPMKLVLQLATETWPGATKEIEVAPHLNNVDSILAVLRSKDLISP